MLKNIVFSEGLIQIARDGDSKLVVKITDPEDGKMKLAVNGDTATVENSVLQIEGKVSVETGEALFRNLMTTVKDFMLEILKEEMDEIANLTDDEWDELLDDMCADFLAEQGWSEEFEQVQGQPKG